MLRKGHKISRGGWFYPAYTQVIIHQIFFTMPEPP
jgi:hypothetical protein